MSEIQSHEPLQHFFNGNEMADWIKLQTSLGARRPGSKAGIKNEDFLFSKLKDFGLKDVRKEPVPLDAWDLSHHSLSLGCGEHWEELPFFPIPYCPFTQDNPVEAPIVYVSRNVKGPQNTWKGAIVVTEIGFPQIDTDSFLKISLGIYDPEKTLGGTKAPAVWIRLGWELYRTAFDSGAVGFIGVLIDQPGGTCEMYAPYGFREKDIWDKPLPGGWIRKQDGPLLKKGAHQGLRVKMSIQGKRRPAISHNIVGKVEGSSGETVVVSCHHDSPFSSPVEDASGISVVLMLAKYFAQRKPPLKRTLVFLFTSGHFYGSIGTRSFLKTHTNDIVKQTALAVSIEHIALEAVETPQGELFATGLPQIAGIFVPFHRQIANEILSLLKKHRLHRTVLLPPEGPLGDYPPTDGGDWYKAGVPVVNYISNPGYLLTSLDDLRWVDWDRLPKVAGAFAEMIQQFDERPRKDFKRINGYGLYALMKLMRLKEIVW